MLIHNADITGSLTINGTRFNTGSFSGSFTGTIAGVSATASYVEYTNVANKPTLVSGSSQVTYSGLTGVPVGIVSGSSQVAGFGIFATTGSNQFNGSQAITGSLTVTGAIVAQTLNVQQVTSSVVFSSGSNVFGNSLGNTQQFTGSVGVTGSLTVAGAGTFSNSVGISRTPSSGFKLDIQGNEGLRILDNDVLRSIIITPPNSGATGVISTASGQGLSIQATNVAGNLTFETAGVERMRITSSGSIEIGTTGFSSPSGADRFIGVYGAQDSSLILQDAVQLWELYVNDDFYINRGLTNVLTALRSNGNVGIGIDAPSRKLQVREAGTSTSGDVIAVRNDNATSGAFINFIAGGNNAPSIGAKGNDLVFTADGYAGAERMRILTGGGLTFNGDTAAANALDDYEEGTWTPTIEGSSSNPTLTYSTRLGYYTKVGRVVTIHCALQPNNTSVAGSGHLRFGGLPFTSANLPDNIGVGVASTNGNFSWGANKTMLVFNTSANSSKITPLAMENGTAEATIPVTNFNNSDKYLFFSITYMAT